MIAITGATGNLGNATIAHLLKNTDPNKIVAIVRNQQKATDLETLGVQIRVADYHDKEALNDALQGIEKVVLISSSDFNDRLQQHKNVIDAAKNNRVQRFLYTSVSMANFENSVIQPMMSDHYQTEDYLKNAGLNFTILQHNLYADILPMFLGENVTKTGVFFPVGDGKVPFALRREMAEAIANVLTSSGHDNKTYRISSNESYDFQTIAKAITKATHQEVPFVDADLTQFESVLKGANLPEHIIGMTVGFATAMKNGDFDYATNDLETLIGRKPAGAEEAMRELFGKH